MAMIYSHSMLATIELRVQHECQILCDIVVLESHSRLSARNAAIQLPVTLRIVEGEPLECLIAHRRGNP
jgi:hypothetical protein